MNERTRPEKSIRQHLIEAGLIFILGMPFALLFCLNCWDRVEFFYTEVPFSGVIWVVLWKGNEVIFILLDRYFPWNKAPLKRLLVNILVTIFYTVVAMNGITLLYLYLRGIPLGQLTPEMAINFSGTAVIITIIVATFLSARNFFLSWRNLAVQHERLKKESLSSRYEVLKQQVNPHFLFNSLNVLTNLVYEDPDLSAQFIKKLSEVYRYVLETHKKEVLPLEEELAFVRSYVFLQKMRYGDQLEVEFDLPRGKSVLIPPLALQMLIENAIKHNEISDRHPLRIRVECQEGNILVTNAIRKRERLPERSEKIGLANIRSRYELLSDRPVVTEEMNGQFVVALPAIYEES